MLVRQGKRSWVGKVTVLSLPLGLSQRGDNWPLQTTRAGLSSPSVLHRRKQRFAPIQRCSRRDKLDGELSPNDHSFMAVAVNCGLRRDKPNGRLNTNHELYLDQIELAPYYAARRIEADA